MWQKGNGSRIALMAAGLPPNPNSAASCSPSNGSGEASATEASHDTMATCRSPAYGIFDVPTLRRTTTGLARAAFSAMPLMPSRRTSSAQTSAGSTPDGHPQHQQVVQHVGALGDQGVAIAGDRLDQALDRFLAEFLRHLGRPARQQPGGVADGGIGVAAALDHGEQPVEDNGVRPTGDAATLATPDFFDLPAGFRDALATVADALAGGPRSSSWSDFAMLRQPRAADEPAGRHRPRPA